MIRKAQFTLAIVLKLLMLASAYAATPEEIRLAIAIKEAELRLSLVPVASETTYPQSIENPFIAEPYEGPGCEPGHQAAAPTVTSRPAVPVVVDRQLSPGGEWRWSAERFQWEPVPKPKPVKVAIPRAPRTWTYHGGNTRSALMGHITREHGYSAAQLAPYSYQELVRIHSLAHEGTHLSLPAARTAAPRSPVRAPVSNCPNGNCPNGNCSRPGLFGGLFRR